MRHCNPFVKPSGPPVAFPNGQDRLARISGRDGRIVWDIPLISPTDRTSAVTSDGPHPFQFGDLDGDGSLDVVIVIPPSPADGRTVIELKAVSLDDGKPIWVHRLRYDHTEMFKAQVVVGDLDGDGRAEVLVDNRVPDAIPPRPMLEALDGRDGQVLWTWRPVYPDSHAISWSPPYLITDLDGDGRREIGLVLYGGDKQSRILLLDARGREVVRRELPEGNHWGWTLNAADLDGDGRDELLVIGKRLLVLGPGLKEIWSRPSLDNPLGVRSLSASSGRPAAVIVSPWLGLAGTDGRPLWAGQSPTWGVPRLGLIDAGDSTRLPLWAELAPGATVCRSALPVTPAGRPAPPVGLPVRPGLARDDPRWTRPLPWTDPILTTIGPTGILAAVGLALVNAVVPIGVISLLAGRRRWNLRVLMALPVAAAVPLSVFLACEPSIPAQIGARPVSARIVFVLITLAGLSIVAYAGFACLSLIRRRWRALAVVAAFTIFASVIIGSAWIRQDRRTMPAIERYDWSSWYLAAVPGAYAVGSLLLTGWMLRSPYRWLRRPRRPEVVTP